MNITPQLADYTQADIKSLYKSGSIVPKVDTYGNVIIQNVTDQMYSSSITIPLTNAVFSPSKVETKLDPNFYQL